jgi:hypothetical protein
MPAKKAHKVKLSGIAKDLDRAIKALGKIQKKKSTLAPDDAQRLDQSVQDLLQAKQLVASSCTGGKKMTAIFAPSSGS